MEEHHQIIQQHLPSLEKLPKESSNEDEEKTISYTDNPINDTHLDQDEQQLDLDINEPANDASASNFTGDIPESNDASASNLTNDIPDSTSAADIIGLEQSVSQSLNQDQSQIKEEELASSEAIIPSSSEQIFFSEQSGKIGESQQRLETGSSSEQVLFSDQMVLDNQPTTMDNQPTTTMDNQPTTTNPNPASQLYGVNGTTTETHINGEFTEPKEQLDPILVKEQFKFLSKTITAMKKRKDAYIFLNPVDPVALNIPTYFTVIKHPIDISTIEKKMQAKLYATADADLELIFTNCFTFNGHESAVALIGKSCQAWLHKEVEKLPRTLSAALAAVQKKRPGRPSDFNSRPSLPAREEVGKRRMAASVSSKKNSVELKFCAHVQKEFYKKAHQPYTWPFLNPVDPVALNIPTYFTIVKYPMDLSTMKRKLDNGEYTCAEEYEADFRLMLENCYKFNGIGSDIYNLGKQVEALFNSKWSEKHSFMSGHGEFVPKPLQSYSDEDEDEDDEDQQQINMVKTQLSLLNQQLQLLKEKQRKKKQRRSIVSATSAGSNLVGALSYFPPTAAAAPLAAPNAPVYPKPQITPKAKKGAKRGRKKRAHVSSDDERMPDTDITYEQKRELSDNINILPPEKLPEVFEIIKENADINAVNDEEFELDIDSLAKPVLWKLYLFVKRHTRPPKKTKYEDQAGGDQSVLGPVAASSSSEAESVDSDSGSD